MGLFNKWKKSAAKSRLMKSASNQVQAGSMDSAVHEIFSVYESDEAFTNIIARFDVSPADMKAIITGLMFSGAGGTYRGHFVPVSAVLFHDTLAYLLRSERGQVPKAQAYFAIQEYFQSGEIVFQPEREFH